ncbi:hypothetical protein DMB92_08470 [Campylobacter sp. MIT 99-7217]|uniref:hypothetical protein n=1 Tax=Campylobacter sp. MIT 99-7217 TaxID=535091 RepID=UPI00115A9139|nr:hypothetical protein [Campylobacter sp. MIT 99-7217]TQR29161.1 hypothetical protein DMB92_08470 [Campylobacter sp. MIT 99-7217]
MTPLLTPPKMLALTLKELALMQRAQANLANIDEITREIVARASKDADEFCARKNVPDFIWEDFAYIRIKIYLKIVLDEEDKLLLEQAIKRVEKASEILEDGTFSTLKLRVLERKDRF